MSDEAMTAVHDVEADAARRRAILLMLSMRRFIVDYYGERGPDYFDYNREENCSPCSCCEAWWCFDTLFAYREWRED